MRANATTLKLLASAFFVSVSTPAAMAANEIAFNYNGTVTRDGVDVATNSIGPDDLPLSAHYGQDTLMNAYNNGVFVMPQSGVRYAEWSAKDIKAGKYCVGIVYTSNESRPLSLSVDGNVVLYKQWSTTTGGWDTAHRKNILADNPIYLNGSQAYVKLAADAYPGENWPHFQQLTLTPTQNEKCQ